jgi:chromosomal replication initiation ATPase DnaA
MCDKCRELEKKIERYRRLASSMNDQLTIDRFNQAIKDAEAEKAKLHPEQQR